MDALIIVIGLMMLMFIVVIFTGKRIDCVYDGCNGTMTSFEYTGDHSGPAPDHVHYKCDTCGKEHEVMV